MEQGWSSGISPHLKERISPGNRLEQLKEAFEAQRQLRMRIDRMKGGRLTDLSLIPYLYGEYRKIAEAEGFSADSRNGNHKQFLMVLLLLYCPEAIFGGKIPRGFRDAVASVLHVKGHIVYSMRDRATVWYMTYPEFSNEVDMAYSLIVGDNEKERARL